MPKRNKTWTPPPKPPEPWTDAPDIREKYEEAHTWIKKTPQPTVKPTTRKKPRTGKTVEEMVREAMEEVNIDPPDPRLPFPPTGTGGGDRYPPDYPPDYYGEAIEDDDEIPYPPPYTERPGGTRPRAKPKKYPVKQKPEPEKPEPEKPKSRVGVIKLD